MKREECFLSRGLVPEVGGKDVKEAGRREDCRGQFLLALDIAFREIRITR